MRPSDSVATAMVLGIVSGVGDLAETTMAFVSALAQLTGESEIETHERLLNAARETWAEYTDEEAEELRQTFSAIELGIREQLERARIPTKFEI